MQITEVDDFGVTIFTLKGRIDSEGVEDLKTTLRAALMEGKHNLILEMSEVHYINSAGLRVLAEVVTASVDNGGDLRLVGLTDKVRRVFEIIGFVRFFRIYDSVLEAMDDLGG